MKKKILITGASGFVGSSFCLQFANRSDVEIMGLGRRETDLPLYVRADLTKPLQLAWKPDVVIHAAARSSPWGSLREFRKQNVSATQHVIDFCVANQVKKLIYVSSSSVFYRDEDQFDLNEESPLGPNFINHYARTKYEGEELVRRYPGAWAILRPRAVFGPRDSVLFPRLLRAASEGKMTTITRPGDPAVGDLIYIDSLCDYLMRAALDDTLTGEYNLTNQRPVEIQSFIADIFSRLDLPPTSRTITREKAMRIATVIEWIYRIFLPSKEPPITRFGVSVLGYSKTFDVSKSISKMGMPSVSQEEGVERFIEWQKAMWREKV